MVGKTGPRQLFLFLDARIVRMELPEIAPNGSLSKCRLYILKHLVSKYKKTKQTKTKNISCLFLPQSSIYIDDMIKKSLRKKIHYSLRLFVLFRRCGPRKRIVPLIICGIYLGRSGRPYFNPFLSGTTFVVCSFRLLRHDTA